MSSLQHERSQFCPTFSAGMWCRMHKKKLCPLIHKWSLFNAAKKAKKRDTGFAKFDWADWEGIKALGFGTATPVNGQHLKVDEAHQLAESKWGQYTTDADSFTVGESRSEDSNKVTLEKLEHNFGFHILYGPTYCNNYLPIQNSYIEPSQTSQALGFNHTETQDHGIVDLAVAPARKKLSKPLTEFKPFPRLPSEIRLVIWQFAVHHPYNPTVYIQRYINCTGGIDYYDLICRSLTPIVLRINSESRTVGLKHYNLLFGNTTYLHQSTGTVFLQHAGSAEIAQFVATVPVHELETIENFAIPLAHWIWTDGSSQQAIWQFPNIKRLMMMFNTDREDFLLTEEHYMEIRNDLKQPKDMRRGWKVPQIGLVRASLVKHFLRFNSFT